MTEEGIGSSETPVVEDVHEDSDHEEEQKEEEEEDECRVCRGPAEEGHPLYAPCKCSGSIGLVHQDCLTSWLEVTRGDGRCELCKTKFRFDPQYAENTPDRLPASEVVLGLSSRFIARWLPLALRILLAMTLWLVVAPFLTACLYHGWMHRPSSILGRWSADLIPGDIVSGAILGATIIISFLSIMSFADFLRVHWADPAAAGRGRRPAQNNAFEEDDEEEAIVENAIADYWDTLTTQKAKKEKLDSHHDEKAADDDSSDSEYGPDEHNDYEDDYSDDYVDEDDDDDEDEVDEDEIPPLQDNANNDEPANQVPNENPAFDPLDPALQDDQEDMEINVALDELLGIRGPPSTLVRNVLWLLAFNASYLGFFAFVPKTVGSAVYSGILNTTVGEKIFKSIPYMYSDDQNRTTVHSSILALNHVSDELDTTFRLPDFATIVLGYFSIAAMVVLMRYGWIFAQTFRQRFSVENTRIRLDDRRRMWRNALQQDRRRGGRLNELDEALLEIGADTALGAALTFSVAIVKAGVLLFLKMFILPLILGVLLDASTVSLLGQTLADRLTFAGADLFSFILLHWVAGITFMLLVTVFLLQLREVIHPDILAPVIRPQEPQPDLLGNLMKESVIVHVKRMLLSLAIYVPGLLLYVTVPVQVLLKSGIASPASFKLHFWHLLKPEMQIPLELIVFHLSMLALLERYKNTIGQMQHEWMKTMCRIMGLTNHVLPLSIESFELVGEKRLFLESEESIDPFWYDLAKKTDGYDHLIESKIRKEKEIIRTKGITRQNGERVIMASATSIRLPGSQDASKDTLLPTKLGRYRLQLTGMGANDFMIEVWKEIPGIEIPRPPDGWDDLGAGGAFVQGRWAWSKEKPSTIERGVAKRTVFKDPDTQERSFSLMTKTVFLILSGWLSASCVAFCFITAPLFVGRFLYLLFRIDDQYIHDPLAFVLGGCLVFPFTAAVISVANPSHGDFRDRVRRWMNSFKLPPRRKLITFLFSAFLWFFVAPMAFGLAYELATVMTAEWFLGGEKFMSVSSLILSWLVGFVALNVWAFFSYHRVFTKGFWANVGNGMLEPPLDENGNPIPVQNHRDAEADGNSMDWQGKQGRIARFYGAWKSCLTEWDWEKVDRVALLDEFAIPITKQLASTVVGSTLSFVFLMHFTPYLFRIERGNVVIPLVGEVGRGIFGRSAFRVCIFVHILVQLCSSFRAQLAVWFEAAHAAARDDRYLIGEILMNYEG